MRLRHRLVKALCDELASLVGAMTSQLFLCERVMDGGHDHYDVIEVTFGVACKPCIDSGRTLTSQSTEPDAEVLITTQAWQIQVERLSGLIISVAHNLFRSSL